MKISRWAALWVLVVAVLAAIEIGLVTGTLNPYNLGAQVYAILFAVAVISILSFVGATFLGIYVSHRILATQEFTPFEEEMLRMREDVKVLRDRVDELALHVRGNPPDRKP